MVNTLANVPSRIRLSPQIQQITTVEDSELQKHLDLVKKWGLNFSPAVADEDGIAIYEKWLSIERDLRDDLEERRTKVLISLNNQLPYTLIRLHRLLAGVLGESNYKLVVHNCELRLELEVGSTSVFESVLRMLEQIVPVNVYLAVTRKINYSTSILIGSAHTVGADIKITPRTTKMLNTSVKCNVGSCVYLSQVLTIQPRINLKSKFYTTNLTYSGTWLDMNLTIKPNI